MQCNLGQRQVLIFRSTILENNWRITDVTTAFSPDPQNGAQFIAQPAAASIWDTTPATITFYDGFYLSPTWNQIVNVNVTGTIPPIQRIVASNTI